MGAGALVAVVLGLALAGLLAGARFARRARRAGAALPALPGYYGWYVALWTGLPALMLLLLWVATQDWVVRQLVIAGLPEEMKSLPADRLALEITNLRNLAYGLVPREGASPAALAAADSYLRLRGLARLACGSSPSPPPSAGLPSRWPICARSCGRGMRSSA